MLRNSDNGSNLSNNKTSKISEFDQMKLGGLKPKIDQKQTLAVNSMVGLIWWTLKYYTVEKTISEFGR